MLQLPCMLVCSFVCANRTRDRGCSKHPVFPVLYFEEGKRNANLGRSAPRERETVSTVIASSRDGYEAPRNNPCHLTHRHCSMGMRGAPHRRPVAGEGSESGPSPTHPERGSGYETASDRKMPASTRQRNSGESGGGDSLGVQPVNFSSA